MPIKITGQRKQLELRTKNGVEILESFKDAIERFKEGKIYLVVYPLTDFGELMNNIREEQILNPTPAAYWEAYDKIV